MRGRRLILLLGLYVSLDLANPFMPGAFNFNPDDSVEGVHFREQTFQSRLAAAPIPLPVRSLPEQRPRVTRQLADTPAVSEWFVDLRRRQSSSSDPPLTEDH